MPGLAGLFLVAAGLGFVAHRASLCTVRAVAEILTTRRARMLASFLKAAAWATAVTLAVAAAAGMGVRGAVFPTTSAGLAGGFCFGAGSVVNGGCAFSTLAHLIEGELSYLATIAGFVAGLAVAGALAAAPAGGAAATDPPLALAAVLCAWAAVEAWRLVRTRDRSSRWWTRATAERYRLSTAAVVLGLGGGLLAAVHGSWTYTASLHRAVAGQAAALADAGFALALAGGMWISAAQRGAVRIRWAGPWGRRAVGGTFMGFGAWFVPGGNDALVLRGIPTLSPHALPVYAAVLAGAFAVLAVVPGRLEVRCDGDVCRG